MNKEEIQKAMRNAYNARIKKARQECDLLYSLLKNIEQGKESINRMAEARQWLARMTQAMHEASAYHSAYDTLTDKQEVA